MLSHTEAGAPRTTSNNPVLGQHLTVLRLDVLGWAAASALAREKA